MYTNEENNVLFIASRPSHNSSQIRNILSIKLYYSVVYVNLHSCLDFGTHC